MATAREQVVKRLRLASDGMVKDGRANAFLEAVENQDTGSVAILGLAKKFKKCEKSGVPLKPEVVSDSMDVLEKAMTGNIELRARVNALVDAMKDVNRNAGETDGELPEDYEEFLLARFNGAEASVESDPAFRTLRKITKPEDAAGAAADEDDDVVAEEEDEDEAANLKCPITTGLLEKPMKSSKCGHTFSHKAITSMLRGKPGGIPCPIYGCSHTIKLADLQPDKEKEYALRRAKAQSQREATQDADDADEAL